uniref:NHS like 3 n=1 Tax=Maylandia zebra TaxID=106582 RepID=A0A3P9BZ78_9CICH
MVVYLRKSIHSLLSIFKKKGESGPKVNEDQKRLTVHYTASQHYQENVFIEGSRPQYLEDLHTEAQEGLKIQQQEGKTRILKPEMCTCESFVFLLTGSTFKPLNPIKRQDKSRKKTRRTTIMGIPNQVQKELGTLKVLFFVDDELKLYYHVTNGANIDYWQFVTFTYETFSVFFQGPVMSISPQATYLSTIIPNAVMPASIEFIEIDRSTSRTLSPLLSRRSDGDTSQTNHYHNDSTLATSASGSNWSESKSSETIISNSSPLSSKGSTQSSNSSQRVSTESGESVAVAAGEEAKNKKKRSLSVMKTKQPPAPPRRSNSLHSNKIRGNSRVLVSTNSTKIPEDVSNFLRSSSPDSSTNPLSSAKASSNEDGLSPESSSSLQKVPPEDGKFERTISPSSGYSSQSGTPTLSPKGISPTSPEKQKKKPVKPERSASRASSSAASPSSSLANTEVSVCSSNQPPQGSSPTVATKDLALKNNTSTFREEVNELLNIPPPPKVKAPCPPPPETWVHSRRTLELLCGPCPNVKQKAAQVQESTTLFDESKAEMDRSEVQSMQTLSIEVPRINKFSPPPTPPPAYHPTPPLSRKTPPSAVSTPPNDLQRVQEEIHIVESSWPPPPPPLEGDSVFDGVDEVDFPPPPPPSIITDSAPDVMAGCSLQIEDPPVSISTQFSALTVPVAPPLPSDNLTHGVNFRRHSSLANRDARTKELLSRHKSVPIPKEDANIPLVTPSLLQMVRLRSVNMTEDQDNSPVSIQGSQNIPQKPIRKSLSLKSPPQAIKSSSVTMTSPSMRLQEAIRMKTAAMSSRDGLPSKLGVKSSTYSCVSDPGALPRKSHEGYDMHKSPASTASFIFSRSTKKVVIETASSPDAQANLKQSLAAELMQVSDQSKAAVFTFDGVKCDKVPPPVAKKPTQSSINSSPSLPNSLSKMEVNVKGNGH